MMHHSNVYKWITEKENRRKLLIAINQPLTARQVSRKTALSLDSCSHILRKFAARGLVLCLNPKSRNSRLYALTAAGIKYQKPLHKQLGISTKPYHLPDIDWPLYGWVCFDHRSAVIRTLNKPMQPSEIKRVLRVHTSDLKISANNIRDIIRLFLSKHIVEPVTVKKRAFPRYQLTDIGSQFKELLTQAHMKA